MSENTPANPTAEIAAIPSKEDALLDLDELAQSAEYNYELDCIARIRACIESTDERYRKVVEAADATMQAFHALRNCDCVADCMAREVGSCHYGSVCDAADTYRSIRLAALKGGTDMSDTCPTCGSDDPKRKWSVPHSSDRCSWQRGPWSFACPDPFHDTTNTRPEEDAVRNMSELLAVPTDSDGYVTVRANQYDAMVAVIAAVDRRKWCPLCTSAERTHSITCPMGRLLKEAPHA